MICILDAVITFMVGLAIFPALFHYIAVSGTSASELGMGGIGLVFLTLPLVFGEMPMIGRLVSLLFFTMTAIAALTSVVSIVEVVTQFIIQCHRIYRTRAAILVTCVCLVGAVPVAISLGSSLNGGSLLCLFGKNLLEILDGVTNTILMPLCAMAACLAMGWCSDRSLSGSESLRLQRTLRVIMKLVAPLLIAVIAGVLLLLVYLGLAWLGASASEVYPPDISRAALVISIVQRLLGRPGLVLFTADSLGLPMPWLHRMPLANVDMAWILPSVLCGVAAFLYRLPWLERAED